MFGKIIYYDKKAVAEYKSVISGKPNLEIEEYDVSNDKGIIADLKLVSADVKASKSYKAKVQESDLYDCDLFEKMLIGRDDYFDFTISSDYDITTVPNDIKKMEDEIEYRKLVVRKKALDDVKVARAQGDLSENFEYKAAKQFKNQNESRIRYLEKMIKTAVVISDESNDDEVGMFNTVDVYFEDDDETETYKIVTTVRGNSLKNLISKESPLGAAIFGHKVGDRCEVKVNDSYSYFVKIMKIENTVDDGSDDLRKF